MEIVMNGTTREVKFTYNSFKYLEEFSFKEIGELEDKPFKLIAIVRQLLIGGLNHDPKILVRPIEVDKYVEEITEDGTIAEMLEPIIKELENSGFFKALQSKETPKKTRK